MGKGRLNASPNWRTGRQKAGAEITLIDKGYEYRESTKIVLKKGWNNILLKYPADSF